MCWSVHPSLPGELAVARLSRPAPRCSEAFVTPPELAHPLRWGRALGPGTQVHTVWLGVDALPGDNMFACPLGREWLCFLPPVIVTICFPPSCLLMFSCFKTEMSQIGS